MSTKLLFCLEAQAGLKNDFNWIKREATHTLEDDDHETGVQVKRANDRPSA